MVAQSCFSRRPAKTLLPPHLCPGHLHSSLILSLFPIFSCSFFFILLLLGQFLSCLLTPAPFRTFSLLLCLVFSPSRAPNFCMLPFITLLQPVTQITPQKPLPPQALVKCEEAGLAKPIGVSSFNRRQLEMILKSQGSSTSPGAPATRPTSSPSSSADSFRISTSPQWHPSLCCTFAHRCFNVCFTLLNTVPKAMSLYKKHRRVRVEDNLLGIMVVGPRDLEVAD